MKQCLERPVSTAVQSCNKVPLPDGGIGWWLWVTTQPRGYMAW